LIPSPARGNQKAMKLKMVLRAVVVVEEEGDDVGDDGGS
jgi:hypothetical protein